MNKIPNQNDIIPLTYRIFTLQNHLIYLTLSMEKVDAEKLPPDLRRAVEQVLRVLHEDW